MTSSRGRVTLALLALLLLVLIGAIINSVQDDQPTGAVVPVVFVR